MVRALTRLNSIQTIFNLPRWKFADLFQHSNNVDEMTENAATTLLFATTSFRMINFYWHQLRYVKLIKAVDRELRVMMERKEEAERKIITSCIEYGRRLTVSFWSIAVFTGSLMCIHSAVQVIYYQPGQGSPPSILRSWFPFDHSWIIYGVQFYVMTIGMLIVPCWHSFIVSFMVFAIMRLKIVNHKLTEIGEKPENCQLVTCLNEREKLVAFIVELSSLISSSLFLDFILFSSLLCALLFQATRVSYCNPLMLFCSFQLNSNRAGWGRHSIGYNLSLHCNNDNNSVDVLPPRQRNYISSETNWECFLSNATPI